MVLCTTFASLWDGEILVYCVHPRAQSDDLVTQILSGAITGPTDCGAVRRVRDALYPLRNDDRRDGELLERQGFTPEAWSDAPDGTPLDTPIPAPAMPEGFSIRQVAGERELAAIVALHQAVFTAASARRERLA